jgi:hypothetical protein
VKALFTYLTGGRAGQAVTLGKSYALLGRAPHADVRFGPDHDLAVSARHAAVVLRAGTWVLRDLASTNGTFVNGTKVDGEVTLADQDLIRLGDGGPLVRFGVLQESWAGPSLEAEVPPDELEPEPGAPPVPRTPLAVPAAEPVALLAARSGWTRRGAGLALAVAAALVLALVLTDGSTPAPVSPVATEQVELIARADSLFALLDGRRSGQDATAVEATALLAETARLRSRIRRLSSQAAARPLRDSLDSLEARARRLGS